MQGTVDLKRLKLFRQVVECGGLSAAEKVLNINLPTISAHLSSLEAKLGMRLCERGRKGFRLTQQGQRVLAACERLFEHVENFRSDISELSQQLAGSLRLGMVDNTISAPPAGWCPPCAHCAAATLAWTSVSTYATPSNWNGPCWKSASTWPWGPSA
jgi:DNA-binding transcriptional LysR family regulator